MIWSYEMIIHHCLPIASPHALAVQLKHFPALNQRPFQLQPPRLQSLSTSDCALSTAQHSAEQNGTWRPFVLRQHKLPAGSHPPDVPESGAVSTFIPDAASSLSAAEASERKDKISRSIFRFRKCQLE